MMIKIPTVARDMTERDLESQGIHPCFYSQAGPALHTTPCYDSPEEAETEAKRWAARYKDQTWPGGMATVLALVECTAQPNESMTGGVWVGVVNYYYSNC